MNFARGFGFALIQLGLTLLSLYTWIIIIRAVISWVSPDPHNPLVQLLHRITEPVLRPLRHLVPPHKLGGLDISPILAILAIQFVKYVIVYSLSPARPF